MSKYLFISDFMMLSTRTEIAVSKVVPRRGRNDSLGQIRRRMRPVDGKGMRSFAGPSLLTHIGEAQSREVVSRVMHGCMHRIFF